MGSTASVVSVVRKEGYKPIDSSDVTDLKSAKEEITRIRGQIRELQQATDANPKLELGDAAQSIVARMHAEHGPHHGALDFEVLRQRWGFPSELDSADEPSVSEVMTTNLQVDGPMRDLVDAIRLSIGIPDDNKEYFFVYVYPWESKPGDESNKSNDDNFVGGFVYFTGFWNGFNSKTDLVGANRVTFQFDGVEHDREGGNSYSVRLLKIAMIPGGAPTPEINSWGRDPSLQVGQMPTTINAMNGSVCRAFSKLVPGATRWGWITPHEARALADSIGDAVIAGKDGSIIFEIPSAKQADGTKGEPDRLMYSLVMRRLLDTPPHVQKVSMPKKYIQKFAEQYIQGKRSQRAQKQEKSREAQSVQIINGEPVPKCERRASQFGVVRERPLRMLILLGGSGAGKSTLLKFFEANGVDIKGDWVLSGLDEFLEFVPEYLLATRDPTIGYRTAADSCYKDAIKIAQAVNQLCDERRHHLIIEDTGKDVARTQAFIEQGVQQGRDVTVALVDNDPEIAVTRALGRFQLTGRFSSAEYVRGSFGNVFENYCYMKRLAHAGELEVSTFIYVDNSVEVARYWLDARPNVLSPAAPLISPERFCQDAVRYRAHASVLARVLEFDPRVEDAYQEYIKFQLSTQTSAEDADSKILRLPRVRRSSL